MKKNCRLDKLLLVIGCWLLVSCSGPTQQQSSIDNPKSEIYYCPMHPDVQQNCPGVCPKPECHNMPLVVKNDQYLESALKPVSSNVLSNIHIINPIFKKLPVEVEALGYIDYDNLTRYDISSRYSGRIDKLYIKFNYQPIKKGDVVFDVYSPDLVTAQENLLYLLKTSPDEKELINAAKQKLKLLQLTQEQIDELINTKKIKYAMPVYSKYDGHVHEMADSQMPPQAMGDLLKTPILSVKEGMYVERGKVLFNVVDPYTVVVMLKVKASDIGKIHKDQKVNFSVNNDTNMIMKGKVDFIEPVFTTNAKTLMVRVNMNNEGHKHKIGSLVKAIIQTDTLETLWVPKSAVVNLGKNKIVWVQKDGTFKAVKVETGASTKDMIEIADGLTENSKIAIEAHYLSDSEGFIKSDEDGD